MIARLGILSYDVMACMACVALAGLGLVGLHYGQPRATALAWSAGALVAAWAWWPRVGGRAGRVRRLLRREFAARGYVESGEAATLLTREMAVHVLDRSPWHFNVTRAWTAKTPDAEIAWGFYRGTVDDERLDGVLATAVFERPFARGAKLVPVDIGPSVETPGGAPGPAVPGRFVVEVGDADPREWAATLPETLGAALLAAQGFSFAMEGRRLVADYVGLRRAAPRDGAGRRTTVVEAFERVVKELARHALEARA